MSGFFGKLFGGRTLDALRAEVARVNALEVEIEKLSDDEIRSGSLDLKAKVAAGATLDGTLPRAFALAREAAKRTLGQRPFDVQILGGIALHQGSVAEMATGEGKTLSAVAPAYLNALAGKGVHLVTVNEYLARRDAVWMGQIYRALGLTVSCLVPNAAFMYDPDWKIPEGAEKLIDKERDTTGNFLVQQEFLRPVSRREAYAADITYGTNHEFGFDYLRDNLAHSLAGMVQREHHFAIIDEVDSILIDEARTPLIIAGPDEQAGSFYKLFSQVAAQLTKDEDFTVDEKLRTVTALDAAVEKVEKMLGLQNLYAPENIRLVHYLEESLKAKALFERDRDYVVKQNEVIIVDEFTGRMLLGRRYQGGLHQAIEAKEGVPIKEESRTYAKISIQNYFRMYQKISGMTGTAQTSAEEFHKVYNLEVVSIPPNRPLARRDADDLIYKNFNAKWRAVVLDVKARHKKGQPMLLGTTSIERNELLSAMLKKAGIPHEVLNAKNNEREGAIIAQAGRVGAVTVATNVAGRGVDIILGGNPPSAEEARKVRELGGLHVIGTERHEARRIDNQLRGRAGRQGDPGSSQFFLSLEDELLRIFGGEKVQNLMERFNLPEDQPIELGMISKVVAQAQAKVEGSNFDLRKHLLEYDDVLNKQRAAVYKRRLEILSALDKNFIANMVFESANRQADAVFAQIEAAKGMEEAQTPDVKKIMREIGVFDHEATDAELDRENLERTLREKSQAVAGHEQVVGQLLSMIDMLWVNHLEELEAVSGSVGLRAYGQHDPLVEYRHEAHTLFKSFWSNFDGLVFGNIFKLLQANVGQSGVQQGIPAHTLQSAGSKVGRNDPCPCGSGKKYKRCHGA